jgi:TolB-like protein/DNA-binding winged helix-turn-helix (wHTH) protein
MDSNSIAEQQPIRFGEDYEVDLCPRRLRRSSRVLRLERIPLEILILLLERTGEIVTRDQIASRVWGEGVFLDTDNSIRGAIRKLRQVLKDNAKTPRFIETVTGQGYRFVGPITDPEQEHRADDFRSRPAAASEVMPKFTSEVDSGLQSRGLRIEEEATQRKAEAPHAEGDRKPRTQVSGRWLVLSGVALLALLAVAYIATLRRAADATAPSIKSLAVLPLQNLSGDKEEDYFADGMTDEIITDLGKISALRVISRTSVVQYRDAKKPLPEIARELNVDAVVEGTVLRSGDRVRITAQLIRALPERHLWSESYERDTGDVLDLQEDVARDIAREIRVKVTPEEQARLSSPRPVKSEAQEAYLRGLFLSNKRTEPDLEKSIEYFGLAVQKDPSYALAYAALGNSFDMLTYYGHAAPREVCANSYNLALKALTLDAKSAEAHAVLGFCRKVCDRDLRSSEDEYLRAIELNPGFVMAHVWRGEVLSLMKRRTEALTELDRALELDPISWMVSDQRGFVLYMARRYDDAIVQIRKTLELEPRLAHTHCWLGKTYLQKGLLQKGLTELQETASLPGGDSPNFICWLGYAYALSGNRTEAYKIIEAMKAQEQRSFATPCGIATIYCGLGQMNEALTWLDKAYQEHDPMVFNLQVEPAFDPLRSDLRFQDLVRRTMQRR